MMSFIDFYSGMHVTEHNLGLMQKEALEAGSRIKAQLTNNADQVIALVEKIRQYNPTSVMVVGRGSSDHAGLFAKYLIEIELGIPTLHAAPSVATLYNAQLKLDNVLVIAISQSGQSPDILSIMKMATDQKAMTLALVNDVTSPLAELSDHVLPLAVGEELAIAATKSYLATLACLLQLVAYWKADKELIQAVDSIPVSLAKAVASKAILTAKDLKNIGHMIVIGRGFGFAVGMEVALKLKEVCAVQAEAFSSAEFLHGPVRIVSEHFKIIDLHINDESAEVHSDQSKGLAQRGAEIIPLAPAMDSVHPRIEPLCILQRFYLDLERTGRQLGFDPDHPEGLKKVTETI